MKRKPYHLVILDCMKEEAKLVMSSAGAEDRMRGYGNIFRKAELPSNEIISEIVRELERLGNKFPNSCGDTHEAEKYLWYLAQDLKELL